MERIKHNIHQNTDEWLIARSGLITASTFSDFFMGVNTIGYQKAISKVALEKCGLQVESFKGNAITDKGHELEILGKEIYEIGTLETIEEGMFWTYGEWLGASPDGIIGSTGIYEHKGKVSSNTISSAYKNYEKGIRLTEKSNKQHFWQVHFQLYVTGKDYCIYQITAAGMKPLIEKIYKDHVIFTRIEQKIEEVIPLIKSEIEIIKKYKNG